MLADQEKAVRAIIKEVIVENKGVTKPIIKKFAKVLSSAFQEEILSEVLKSLENKSVKQAEAALTQIHDLAGFVDINYNELAEALFEREDLFKFSWWSMSHVLTKADDEQYIKYWKLAYHRKTYQKIISDGGEDAFVRIAGLKNLKDHPELVEIATAFLQRQTFTRDRYFYTTERLLPGTGVIANFSEDAKQIFEKEYVDYLEARNPQHAWEQKTYVSVLCRGLRNYKSKEFRKLLIKKLVLIKIPALQKRMAREFSRSRKYLNLA